MSRRNSCRLREDEGAAHAWVLRFIVGRGLRFEILLLPGVGPVDVEIRRIREELDVLVHDRLFDDVVGADGCCINPKTDASKF